MAVRERFFLCDNVDKCARRLRHDEFLAVELSRYHAHNNPMISRSELFCFSRASNVYTFSVAMPLKLDYELIDPINKVIKNLMEFGLIDLWRRIKAEPNTRSKIAETKAKQHAELHLTPDGTVVLTIHHIVGALVIMAFGYVLAIITFTIEQIVYRKVQKRSKSKFILYLHKQLGSNRIDRPNSEFFCMNNL